MFNDGRKKLVLTTGKTRQKDRIENSTVRRMKLYIFLRNNSGHLRMLSGMYKVNARTIHRDIALLNKAGASIINHPSLGFTIDTINGYKSK